MGIAIHNLIYPTGRIDVVQFCTVLFFSQHSMSTSFNKKQNLLPKYPLFMQGHVQRLGVRGDCGYSHYSMLINHLDVIDFPESHQTGNLQYVYFRSLL